MNDITAVDKQINDFIYEKPDVVVVLLQQSGYNIELKTATLPKITKLVYTALYINKDKTFAESLDNAISNEGELGFVMAIIAIVTSAISGVIAMKEGDANRALQKKLVLAQLSMDEKLSEEKIRADQESVRLTILANTVFDYRVALQKESTIRLRDTWLYVTSLGIGIGILYGVYLIGSKN